MQALILAAMVALAASSPSIVSGVTRHREHLGQCFLTRVLRVETRLGDGQGHNVPGSGSAIAFADGHYNVSYETLAAIDGSRRDDPVKLCVIHVPRGCPPGDHRGILYRGQNLRTHRSWKATDTEHICGGA
ncbi:MAG: hypothetical protein ACJ798_02785 [Phenylobacterium sp.]